MKITGKTKIAELLDYRFKCNHCNHSVPALYVECPAYNHQFTIWEWSHYIKQSKIKKTVQTLDEILFKP